LLDLKAYRLGFAPLLAALVVLAFSLQGVPEPLEPAVGTIEFDAEGAAESARTLARVSPDRRPGSEDAATAADFVLRAFEEVASGSVAEQRFDASVNGEDVELRNVLLTLPGSSDRTILIVAERDTRGGSGAASTASATGVLLELAAQLGVAGRERTVIFGSIDGAGAEAEGARELVEALPERTLVDAAVVISQPGTADPSEPHLITSSGGEAQPSQPLIRTAEETLASRAQAGAGLDDALGQVARIALPAASGAQAALLAEGVDSVAISGAGEVPLPPEAAGDEQLEPESIERFGATVLALVGALDAAPEPTLDEPQSYVRLGDNTIPGWAISLLALALIFPPALPVGLALSRARRDGSARPALGWAAEWALVALTPLLALYLLALAGMIPRPDVPYDPGRFAIGPMEVIALVLFAGLALAAWWILGLRRAPARPEPVVLGAAAGAACLTACLVAWLANPYLALAMAPLAHVVMVHAASGRLAAGAAIGAALVAALPMLALVLHVADALDWGATTPWQLVVLVAGGGLGFLASASLAVALVAVVAVVRAALRPGRRSLGAAPQPPPRGRP
jgi:Peptidase family M28